MCNYQKQINFFLKAPAFNKVGAKVINCSQGLPAGNFTQGNHFTTE